ncbi:hypothetical protein CRT60_30790 [Azospirillum palustre]|uniref:Uncharacterized protein n=1 Tax=Azospirillum palustre TaxID=2044885 RepID=A0A2B8B8E7_9PROT|nr:hypothetical protein [Azospirillum palustre]PGH54201.1 hypothetical protein CRT60_30790 [Azospirillum palustre]
MSNPYPYNQQIASYTPASGDFSGYTFVVATCANGISVGEMMPTDDGSQSLTYQFVSGIDSNGDDNTTVTFLVNPDASEQNAPFYFLAGSSANHLILYSFTPTSNPGDLTSDCVTQVQTVVTLDTPVASSVFYPTTKTLYVVGRNGDLSTWSVDFDTSTGVPSFAQIASNNAYDNTDAGQIQVLLAGNNGNSPYAIATGLCNSTISELLYFDASLEQVGFLNGTLAGSVAIAAAPSGLYMATSTALYRLPSSQIDLSRVSASMFDGEWAAVAAAPGGVTLTSLAYVPMTGNDSYPAGIVLMGGYDGSADNGSDVGVIYAYNPVDGSCQLVIDGISGPVYGLLSDNSTHGMYSNGSTGLGFLNFDAGPDAPIATTLVTNESSSHNGLIGRILRDVVFATVIVATAVAGAPEVGVEAVEVDAAAEGGADAAEDAASDAATGGSEQSDIDADAMGQQFAAEQPDETPTAGV